MELMTTAGWIFMVTSWTVIITLVSYCYYKTLSSQKK
ncbi:MAG: hypothetical protein ACD_77C00152G0001 [uncultured bacterium]|nr:MAG: hypothetical protein ACD_77C00152G0001 [uncultured bacterium]